MVEDRAELRSRPAAGAALSPLRPMARSHQRRAGHPDLPDSVHEQPVVDVRPHAAAPRSVRSGRADPPVVLRGQLRRSHRQRQWLAVRRLRPHRRLSGYLFDPALLPAGPPIHRLRKSRYLGISVESDGRRGPAASGTSLGAARAIRRLLLLRRELLVPAAVPARRRAAGAALERPVSRLRHPDRHGAGGRAPGPRAGARGVSPLQPDPARGRARGAHARRATAGAVGSPMAGWHRAIPRPCASRRRAGPQCWSWPPSS